MKYLAETSLYNFQAWCGGKETLDALVRNGVVDDVECLIENLMADAEEPWTDTEINDFLWFETETIFDLLNMIDENKFRNLYEERVETLTVEKWEEDFCACNDCGDCVCKEYTDTDGCMEYYRNTILSADELHAIEEQAYNEIIDEYGEPFVW